MSLTPDARKYNAPPSLGEQLNRLAMADYEAWCSALSEEIEELSETERAERYSADNAWHEREGNSK